MHLVDFLCRIAALFRRRHELNFIKQNSLIKIEINSEEGRKYNCKEVNESPLDGNCQVKNIIYRAVV